MNTCSYNFFLSHLFMLTHILLLLYMYRDDTLFNLAPQGFGRTSFRLAEVVQVGRIPVYIYNDIPWVPYVGSPLSVYELGYVGRVHHLESLIKHLANIKHDKSFNSEINQKLEKVKLARDSYTYTGVMNQIALFFEFPFSRQHSSLVCSHDLHAASKTASSVLDIQLE